LDAVEQALRVIAGAAGIVTLGIALVMMVAARRRPAGREEGAAHWALRIPLMLVATALFLAAGILLWRPIPLELPAWGRLAADVVGTLLFLGGLLLYLWGLRALGGMFAPSSGFGVRLPERMRLVTWGPYAVVRHPMYAAVITTGMGMLLLYRTWAALAFAISMLGLAVRARREEKVLGQAFGQEWAAYARRVPAFWPRRRKTGL
jgi:protein-S-isoprenylcysteine O-methyltransferase Ste14